MNERDFINTFNELSYDIDGLYSRFALSSNLSDSELWILYIILLNGGEASQCDVCKAFCVSRKTINSAVTKLEKKKILERRSGEGKKVLLSLTDTGKVLAQKTAVPLIKAENEAVKGWTDEEKSMLLDLTKKYYEGLKTALNWGENYDN